MGVLYYFRRGHTAALNRVPSLFFAAVVPSEFNNMEKTPLDPITLSQSDRGTILAVLEGVKAGQDNLDHKVTLWRDATFRAVNLLSQRDIEDEKQRKDRQKTLDNRLWWQGAGIVVILLLLVGFICFSIGRAL